ncbi:conserved Plasmodium protein, unknown function [Plasmodium yoelii]|nr:conserved Plasmodium protein, unknown function [Plasmodium yoelii]CDU18965.1 conserved Plasmodium protein, unknown function [Plasmodium yoelii]VTZ79550.1 conserved Plasmodium protein, unknown function [Plasmodium yoelii]|eukprot:XP_724963.2 conserved Plasmodium protein, unknown function [Plasmodium yoelii]
MRKMPEFRENNINKFSNDKMHFIDDCIEKRDNNNNMQNVSEMIENKMDTKPKEKQYTFNQINELTNYGKHISKTYKKRAYTLGAIDGIGSISILNAPLINPENAKVDPPILQLPSTTNLIKNVHVKANNEKNIDKAYKYRDQNSNKDIIRNMKPLYSIPEYVMNSYMYDNDMDKKGNENIPNDESKCLFQNEYHNSEKKLVETHINSELRKNVENQNNNINISESACFEKGQIVNNTKDPIKYEENKINCISNNNREKMKGKNNGMPMNNDNVNNKNNGNNTNGSKGDRLMYSKTILVKNDDNDNKKYSYESGNFMKNKYTHEYTHAVKNNVNNHNEKLNQDEDKIEFCKLSQIMSQTLTKTLEILANERFS